MKSVIFLALLAFLGLTFAATPSNPVWPKAFSSSVTIVNVTNPEQSFFIRWFRDLGLNKARLDGVVQVGKAAPVFTTTIVDENAKEEYVVFYARDQVSCYTQDVTRPLINPDFSQFTYSGSSIINYIVVNQWYAINTTENNVFVYFEDAETREPVRFTAANNAGDIEEWTFYEFDAAPQDESLFNLEDPIKGICNQIPNKMIKQ